MKLGKTFKNKSWILTALLLSNIASFAQQNKKDFTMGINQHTWYLKPWFWVIAAALLCFLVISALRGDLRQRKF